MGDARVVVTHTLMRGPSLPFYLLILIIDWSLIQIHGCSKNPPCN